MMALTIWMHFKKDEEFIIFYYICFQVISKE